MWYSAATEFKLVKNLNLDLDINLRTYNNASRIEEAFFDIGLTYKFSKYLSAAASYRFTEYNEKDDIFYPRHKWFADLKGKMPLGDFDISARLRFEQRYKTYFKDENDREPQEHLRIKPKVLYDIPSFPVNPYVASELFFPVFNEDKKNLD
jgi:outer membrane protein assembly factor BamA